MTDQVLALQALIDADDQPAFALDAELRYVAFNEAHASIMEALYGAQVERGKPLTECQTVAADRDTALVNLRRALSGERVVTCAYSGQGERRRFYEVTHQPLHDHTGAVAGVVVRATEVTERRRAQEELGQSRALLQSVIDGTTDAVYVKDVQGRYLLFNSAAEMVTGTAAADVLGKDDRVLFPADEAAVVMEGDRRILESGAAATYEEQVTVAGGQIATFLSTKGPVHDAAGNLLGLFGIARDITERSATERRQSRSEARLRAILESTADGILAVDIAEGTYKANRRFAEMWRIPPSVLESDDVEAPLKFALEQLEDPQTFLQGVRTLMESDKTSVETLRLRDGRVFERHTAPIIQEAGVAGRVWSFSDVSAETQARTQLRERERALTTLLANLPGMAYRCANDPSWTMEFVSAGCEELTGHVPEALVGSAAASYADLVLADDKQRLWDTIQAAIAADEAWTTTYRITSADGAVKWVWERGVATVAPDGAIMLEGFIQDITEQHEAQARLQMASAEWRRTFDAMGDSVALFDREGRIRRCNVATAELTGRSIEDLIDRPCYEAFHGTHDYHPHCPQLRAFASGLPETAIVEQDGSWLRITFDPEIDEDGRVCGGVHVVSDVSEIMEAEREIRRLNTDLERRVTARTAQLKAANEELEAFAYSVSHDLRAPLRAIDGFTQMVVEDAAERLDADDVRHLQRARSAAQSMASLIDDLLELSRASRVELSLADVDVSALADDVVAELRAGEPDRAVDVAIAPGLRAVADPTLLRMILSNLLSNAWKFTGKHASARIQVGDADRDGEPAFYVRDNGAGFDMESAGRLFGAFQRLHTAGEFQGSGIGLATVRRLVTKHGGRVWAESEVEKGSVFWFTLGERPPTSAAD